MTDDIPREIRATREAFAAAHGYDVYAMGDTLRALDAASGQEVVTRPPQPPISTTLGGAAPVPTPDAPRSTPASSA